MHRRPRRAERRRATPHRRLFAFLALAVTLVQLFGLGHLVFVNHAICEHGALLEVEPGHDGAASGPKPRAGEAGPDESADDVPAARPAPAADGHHHCDPFALRPAVVAVAPSFEAPAPIEGVLLPIEPDARAAFAPIDLLSLAPKSSPPRASSSLSV